MKIAQENIQTTKQIWLEKIEGVSDEFRQWMREDCRERFRYAITTYYGDHCHGVIDVSNLAEVLDDHEENGEELEDLSKATIEELKKLRHEAQKNKIDEILFD